MAVITLINRKVRCLQAPVANAKCKSSRPKEKGYKLFDGHGFYLMVALSGGKLWRVTYKLDGKISQLVWALTRY